jgi:broad specificity phosphatase PhoE
VTALYLVKHSLPEIDPDTPSAHWVLSGEGQARCAWLADELSRRGVTRLYCSLEPKAAETAALTGERMRAEVLLHANLHENDRTDFGFQDQADLRARIRAFFDRPEQILIGKESARMALARFQAAVGLAQREARDKTIAIVAHGTVITLFVTAHNKHVPAYPLWEHLGLPSFVALDADSYAFDGKVISFPS